MPVRFVSGRSDCGAISFGCVWFRRGLRAVSSQEAGFLGTAEAAGARPEAQTFTPQYQ
jgi:hypothetical protein